MEGPRITLVGAGAAAWSLACGLRTAGLPVALWSRRAEAARDLAQRARATAPDGAGELRAVPELGDALAGADVVLLAVSDRAVGEVAARVAAALAGGHRPAVLHTSGYHGVEPLAPARAAGCAVGGLHPLRPLVADVATDWAGGWFAVVGDEAAAARARELADRLGAHVLALAPGERAKHAYHAGAALLSNGAVGLFDAALACLARAGLGRDEARAALADLLAANVEHLRRLPPERALTGPAARGADRVVAGHLEALGDDAEVARLYRAVTEYLLGLARASGRLGEDGAADVRRVLS